jgi:hypothetical protein
MSKKALLIGINYYATPQNQLNGCINDVINMKNALIDAYDYKEEHVKILRDDVQSLLPTRENIIGELKKIVAETSTLSEIWIHYSGHGTGIQDLNGDETDKKDEAIVPSNYMSAGIINDDELFEIIKEIKCTAIICFDCCHSGTGIDLQYSFSYNGSSFIQSLNNSKQLSNNRIFFFSGCKDSQTSADAYNGESKQAVGAFTDSLLRALRQNGHKVDIMKLYNDLCFIVTKNGFVQSPVLSCSSNIPSYKFERTNVVDKINVITQVVTQVVQVPAPAPAPAPVPAPAKPAQSSSVKPPPPPPKPVKKPTKYMMKF